MSGHSKWSTIKRKKGANDAARGKIFTKLAREVQVAARNGADPNTNFALRLAVEKARAENMPKDNIERSIRRGAGLEKDAAQFESVMYEAYGPNGVAMLVDCLTDNRNRTIGELRRIFTRGGGSLGEPNSVAWQFASKGYFVFNLVDDDGAPTGLDSDELFMAALDAGADDVQISDDAVEVYTDREKFAEVSKALADAGFRPASAELTMKPNQTVTLGAEDGTAVLNLVEQLDELDDVNNVYHNLELTEDVVAAFA
jgi:YebC/PmpR family DNA-binding regulatory protein